MLNRILLAGKVIVCLMLPFAAAFAVADTANHDAVPAAEAPFGVQYSQNLDGAGGYFIRIQNLGDQPLLINDLIINERGECSSVQVIEGGIPLAAGVVEVRENGRDGKLMHAIWLQTGKAIIYGSARYPSLGGPVLKPGGIFRWQTACSPIYAQIATNLGYAEFRFNEHLGANPGIYLGTIASSTPRYLSAGGRQATKANIIRIKTGDDNGADAAASPHDSEVCHSIVDDVLKALSRKLTSTASHMQTTLTAKTRLEIVLSKLSGMARGHLIFSVEDANKDITAMAPIVEDADLVCAARITLAYSIEKSSMIQSARQETISVSYGVDDPDRSPTIRWQHIVATTIGRGLLSIDNDGVRFTDPMMQ